MRKPKRHVRLLAAGGVAGPAAFVGTWAIAGATTPGYSPVENAISDLAAVDASTRVAMTSAFAVYGAGLVAFGLAMREVMEGRAWAAAVATGAAVIGVAATPLGGPAGDRVHAAFAGVGYATLVAVPLLAARPLARRGRRRWARASLAVAGISAASLVASTFGPAHGFWQRLGLTVGDAWIVAAAGLVMLEGLRDESS